MNENVGATASPEPSRLYNGNFRTGCFAPDTLHQFEKRYSSTIIKIMVISIL
ncbi:MAG: hypothetical protein F6J93_04340 [Oscillatoria sp. SIO1A7]|nr:hypothetical protein [Oscillatoria sp. SIO1A7]